MFVHIEVLEGRGCLEGIGSHENDQIVVRVGEPDDLKHMATDSIDAPIIGVPLGLPIPTKLSIKMKHQITKRAFNRDMDKYQLRLYTIKHTGEKPTWLGIVAFRLLRLTDGFVIERWVPMQPATKTEPGALRVRVVVRETEADARAVLASGVAGVPSHTMACEGCCCDVCDPDFQRAKPLIEYFDFNEKHFVSTKIGRTLANSMDCIVS